MFCICCKLVLSSVRLAFIPGSSSDFGSGYQKKVGNSPQKAEDRKETKQRRKKQRVFVSRPFWGRTGCVTAYCQSSALLQPGCIERAGGTLSKRNNPPPDTHAHTPHLCAMCAGCHTHTQGISKGAHTHTHNNAPHFPFFLAYTQKGFLFSSNKVTRPHFRHAGHDPVTRFRYEFISVSSLLPFSLYENEHWYACLYACMVG